MVGGIQHESPEPEDSLLSCPLHCVRNALDFVPDAGMLVSQFESQ